MFKCSAAWARGVDRYGSVRSPAATFENWKEADCVIFSLLLCFFGGTNVFRQGGNGRGHVAIERHAGRVAPGRYANGG